MQGMFVFKGKAVKPPFTVRQEADRVFVNEKQVYPPEVEEKPEFARFGIEDVWSATETEATLKRFGEVERTLEDFRSSKAEVWAEFEATSFEQKTAEIREFLETKGYTTDVSAKYHDVLVPINEEFGIVAMFNEEARMRVMREAEEKFRPATVLEYDVAKDLTEYVDSNLKLGHFLRVENNLLEAIPKDQVDIISEEVETEETVVWDEIAYDEKVAKITEKMARVKPPCSAVIFFPHRSWQKNVVGRASNYWCVLAHKLVAEGYWVRVYLDTAVSLNLWAGVLTHGKTQNLRVLYNEGHGSDDLIDVGQKTAGGSWYYFRSPFVHKYADLSNTVVYIHSCATMSDTKMATAFLSKGACAYLGWQHPTSANPDYCDHVDALFWEPMIDLHSTAIYAKKNVATIDKDFKGAGNRFCRIPIKTWEC